MIKRQQNFIFLYVGLALGLGLLDLLFPDQSFLWGIRFLLIFSLGIWATYFALQGRIPFIGAAAYLLAALGDGFLYLPLALQRPGFPLGGELSFLLSYLLLTKTLIRDQSLRKSFPRGVFILLLCAALFLLGFSPSPGLPLAFCTLGALLVLNISAYTLWKEETPKRPFLQSAFSATFAMLLCDLLVGLGLYFSVPQGVYETGLILTWIVYLFGWSALLPHLQKTLNGFSP